MHLWRTVDAVVRLTVIIAEVRTLGLWVHSMLHAQGVQVILYVSTHGMPTQYTLIV